MAEEKRPLPATVAHVLSDHRLVINRGKADGIRDGQRFLIYQESGEVIVDPEDRRILGTLEIVRGTGKVIHTQEQMATIESDMRSPSEKRIVRQGAAFLGPLRGSEETIITPADLDPFDGPQTGDKAKPI